jgi:2'-5' RNA ligase
MAHALELYFDADADEAVRAIWRAIDSPLIAAGARPHVSVAVAETCDAVALREALDFSRVHDLHIVLESVDAFPGDEGVVFLRAHESPALKALQHDLWHHFVMRADQPREHYSPPHWIPHCTLAYGVADVAETISKCDVARLPIDARVTEIGLVDVTPSKVTTLWTEAAGR